MTFLHEDACEAPCTLCHRDDWRCDVLGIACREWVHRCPDCEALSPTRAVCNPRLHRATSGGPGVNGSLGCLDHVSTIRGGRLYEGELLGAERREPPMSMKHLIEKLKDRPKTVDDHRDEQKKGWLAALETLYDVIDGWLKDAVAAGVLTTARSQTKVTEQDFGAYQVPVLEIHASGRTVRLEPIGVRVTGVVYAGSRRMLGLKGRVDMVCGPIRIPLVRTASGPWKALPVRGEPCELTVESFSELLGAVLLDE